MLSMRCIRREGKPRFEGEMNQFGVKAFRNTVLEVRVVLKSDIKIISRFKLTECYI